MPAATVARADPLGALEAPVAPPLVVPARTAAAAARGPPPLAAAPPVPASAGVSASALMADRQRYATSFGSPDRIASTPPRAAGYPGLPTAGVPRRPVVTVDDVVWRSRTCLAGVGG